MAWVKKERARKALVDEDVSASVSNWREDGGLRFNMLIGNIKVSLSHSERDFVIAAWAENEKEFGYG